MKFLFSSLLLFVFSFSASNAQVQIGQDIDGEAAGDRSGYSVSMPDANTIAIGADGNDGNASDAGHVRVYVLSGINWVQKGMDIDGEFANNLSGASVCMPDANTIAIGTEQGSQGYNTLEGLVRIYSWNGTNWSQKGFDIYGENLGDVSGSSVSMPDANTVAIASLYNDNDNGQDAGHVRIYSWNGTDWVQKGIDIDGEAADDFSGNSVSMPDNKTVAIGARFNDGNGSNSGHVRIYSWNGTNWIQKGMDIDGEAAGDLSGNSVSMPDNKTVAIGARFNDGNGSNSGHVRIYVWNGTNWIQKGMDIDGEAAGDKSGGSVSMPDIYTLAIGAWNNDGNGADAGHVRIYVWNGTNWVQKGIDIDGEAANDSSGGKSISMPDAYTVAIGAYLNDGNGSSAGHVRIYNLSEVSGLIYNDINQNCIKENESGLQNRKAIINPGNIIVETNSKGLWYLDSLPIGIYTITADTSGKWLPTCPATQTFTVTNSDSLTYAPSFGFVSIEPCPSPQISISYDRMRPGFSNQYIFVNACNDDIATGALNSTYADIELDNLLTVNSATLTYTNLGNNTYRFNLGDLNPGQCNAFSISTTLSTNAVLGQSLCVQANLYPADSCVFDTIPTPIPPDFTPCSLPWDRSSLKVNGWCQNDSIYFTVTNHGSQDMQCYSPVRVYIDGQYISLDSVQLLSGQTATFAFAGDGRTWHLEADQHPLHPGNSYPNATVELCGDSSNFTPGLVNVLPLDDADPVVDIYCGTVTGSYDPNDKTGYPLGLTEEHLIEPNQKIEYKIRFQNTGNDTAFTVVVRDTLDTDLDIFSVRSGVASHAYTFKMYGPRILEWTFNNILLTDSSTNEDKSHGFVCFEVNQNKSLADGTLITNDADIYFDFNSPIITNTTSHKISRNVKLPSYSQTKNLSLNGCDTVFYNGYQYTMPGNYYNLIEGGINTDTLCLLNVSLKQSSSLQLTATECDSYTAPDGQIYTTSGIKKAYFTNAVGCDSTITIDLLVNYSASSNIQESVCDTYTAPDGQLYSSSGIKTATIQTANGCDSIITIDLSILSSSFSYLSESVCDAYTAPDGAAYTTSGIKTAIIQNALGCDSTITIDLSILSSSVSYLSESVCDTYIAPDGATYTNSGIKTAIIPNVAGCDSTITIDLSIHSNSSSLSINSCDVYNAPDGQTYTSSGIKTANLTNVFGCDSVITINLTINTADESVTQNDAELTANATNGNYQWLDCLDNYAVITGENNQTFAPAQNGSYALQVMQNNCIDTSACFDITTVGILENNLGKEMQVFPNPTKGYVSISLGSKYEFVTVKLSDVKGAVLSKKEFTNTKLIELSINSAPGVYFIEVSDSNSNKALVKVVKVVKE